MSISAQILKNARLKNLQEVTKTSFSEQDFEICISINGIDPIPCFYYYNYKLSKALSTCISLQKAEYLNYCDCRDALNHKEREDLVNYLKDFDTLEPDKTRWEVLVLGWNRFNAKNKINNNTKMPNYMEL